MTHARCLRMKVSWKLPLFLAVIIAGPVLAQTAKRSPFATVKDDPRLPRVLLIGDSISIGYTLAVRDELKGAANVHRPPENCQGTIHGLKRIDRWLGTGKWDVIHFNWGLHDLKYMDEKGNLTAVANGRQQSPLAQYAKNLEALVSRLEKTGAKLIFATTTPVPEGAQGRVPADQQAYNDAARRIMRKHDIAVNDLRAFAASLPDSCKLKANVHYSATGYQRLGHEVAQAIAKALPSDRP